MIILKEFDGIFKDKFLFLTGFKAGLESLFFLKIK